MANISVLTVPSDTEIAIELAEELIRSRRLHPYRFRIYYDAKREPARVAVHRVVKNGTAGETEFTSIPAARIWCESALKNGYVVERVIGRECVSASLARRRRSYEYRAKKPVDTDDDSIPF